jgi:hypothetical protein
MFLSNLNTKDRLRFVFLRSQFWFKFTFVRDVFLSKFIFEYWNSDKQQYNCMFHIRDLRSWKILIIKYQSLQFKSFNLLNNNM